MLGGSGVPLQPFSAGLCGWQRPGRSLLGLAPRDTIEMAVCSRRGGGGGGGTGRKKGGRVEPLRAGGHRKGVGEGGGLRLEKGTRAADGVGSGGAVGGSSILGKEEAGFFFFFFPPVPALLDVARRATGASRAAETLGAAGDRGCDRGGVGVGSRRGPNRSLPRSHYRWVEAAAPPPVAQTSGEGGGAGRGGRPVIHHPQNASGKRQKRIKQRGNPTSQPLNTGRRPG